MWAPTLIGCHEASTRDCQQVPGDHERREKVELKPTQKSGLSLLRLDRESVRLTPMEREAGEENLVACFLAAIRFCRTA